MVSLDEALLYLSGCDNRRFTTVQMIPEVVVTEHVNIQKVFQAPLWLLEVTGTVEHFPYAEWTQSRHSISVRQ